MKCNNCGINLKGDNYTFCSNCGSKLDNFVNNEKSNNISMNSSTNIKDDSNNFLIIGILLSLCCSLPFGVAIILINELKYKKLINDGLINEAKKYRDIMIVLIIIGFLVFLGYFIFNIFLSVLEVLLAN